MTGEMTARLGLPLLVPGQAQKEMTHNEALTLLAIAVQPSVLALGMTTPPADPATGACWIVGPVPTGAWAGQANAIAGWTIGGWRFVPPHSGFSVHVAPLGRQATFRSGTWSIQREPGAIVAPSAGDVIDTQARTAIRAILDVLRDQGLVVK
ncbi:hypothetical protein ASE86_12940 [Sphingomonas sp. Leaf33]|uniref:DUF2793 domain-containing protein n=1 Tax=Sphingomonas sp. Leaf33 TaxID=1736215 RepID=UPI0006F941EF|nr:DUF2793 domain-containing protein [Sphingomonas sp. Leaf33]KQN19389.1 hypothetical protein ASE86_12940 [Sphingomonas sp. Leaf33]